MPNAEPWDDLAEPDSVPVRDLTRRALCRALGVSEKELRRLMREGRVQARNVKGHQRFDLPAVFAHLLQDRSADEEQDLKRRKLLVEVTAREREEEKERGELVSVDAVEKIFIDHATMFRNQITAIPSLMHGRIDAEAMTELKKAINDAFAAIADMRMESSDADLSHQD
jgi:hypothetical protein